MKSFKALVKREFWEHKGAIIYTPAIMALVFACLLLIGGLTGDSLVIDNGHRIDFTEHLPHALEQFEQLPEEHRSKGVQIALYAPAIIFGFVMLIISLFYALGSLYDERKDGSILFWKSLPVSDTETVLSKFVAITVLVPVLYFAVIAAFQVFLMVYATVAAWFGGNSGVLIWASSNLFSVLFNTLFALIVGSLWLAPLWGWLMLASSWAKKVSFLWGGLPIFMIGIAEGWIFQSTRFIEMVGERIARGFAIQNSNLHFVSEGDMFDLGVMRWYEALATGEFWLGLVVAAAFLAAAIYTRRYRDES